MSSRAAGRQAGSHCDLADRIGEGDLGTVVPQEPGNGIGWLRGKPRTCSFTIHSWYAAIFAIRRESSDTTPSDRLVRKLVQLRPTLETISLRLPVSMIEDLKVLANRRDVPYQSLLKVFLAERLVRERQPRPE